MNLIVQVTGLPGAGKTTAVKDFLSHANTPIQHIDIRSYRDKARPEQAFRRAIKRALKPVIAESVCGVKVGSGVIVRIEESIDKATEMRLVRGESSDKKELKAEARMLVDEMLPPDITVSNYKELPRLLEILFRSDLPTPCQDTLLVL